MDNSPGMRGFTLLEVVVVLAVLGLLLGVLVPMAYQVFTAERAGALEDELQILYTAIVGTPDKGLFGYVGDVGNYPNTLLDLVRPPVDHAGAPLPGWKGPYVLNPRVENGVWLDPYGRPFEYYLAAGVNGPDRLAIVSRGADGLSTNTSSTPADAAAYAGPDPGEPAYATGVNADNVVFPRVEGNPSAVHVKTDGDVALDVMNWDQNPKVNALVPACPELYTVTAFSLARRTAEASLRYIPGLSFNLAQGQYRVSVTARSSAGPSWTGTVTVFPGAAASRTLNLTGLDSSGTPLFPLTVKNGFSATELEVYEFDSKMSGTLPGQTSGASSTLRVGETRVFTPNGCAQIYVRKKGKTDVVDQFVMPHGAYARQPGAQAAHLLVSNFLGHEHHDHGAGHLHHHQHEHRHHGHHRVYVYRNEILLGTVAHHRQDELFPDLMVGDRITIYDRQGTLLALVTLVSGSNTVRVG